MKTFLLAVASIALGTASVQAADLAAHYTKAPVMAPASGAEGPGFAGAFCFEGTHSVRGHELGQRGQDLVSRDLVRIFAAIGEQHDADPPRRHEPEIA